ncbi:helicase associated domain-containing family protein [Cryptosporidium andersoni]|uniref:Helicase associated domain-containing family protein n=1 Tax=Cryptosporidium andersoni TaxID=117008 RepID=A0A1J4MNT6_9CRYT|nr:helicase associated domain-containing family protein [Cryptosporidium andersoni]
MSKKNIKNQTPIVEISVNNIKNGRFQELKEDIKIPLFNMKPYMKTPKVLLHTFCQKDKRQKPIYQSQSCKGGNFRYAVILKDPKNRDEKSLRFETVESFQNNELAQHYAALLALWHFESARPYHKLLPYPLDEVWKSLNTNKPLVTRQNKFLSEKEKIQNEELRTRTQSENRNKILIMEQKQKFEIPTMYMSSNIRNRIINILSKHIPILTEESKYKTWLFGECKQFIGIPDNFMLPYLVSLKISEISDYLRLKYSKYIPKYVDENKKVIIISVLLWHNINKDDKENIIKQVQLCGFDKYRVETALEMIFMEMEKKYREFKDISYLKGGIYTKFNTSCDMHIILDIKKDYYPTLYISWLCEMWLSLHICDNDLPPLFTSKKSQIEIKGYKDTSKKGNTDICCTLSKQLKILITKTHSDPEKILSFTKNESFNEYIEDTNNELSTKSFSEASKKEFKAKRYNYLSASIYADKIIEEMKNNQVIILHGETGCGKTTQVPILLYEGLTQYTNNGLIYCSEPRRMAATSISIYLNSELSMYYCDKIVGYKVRFKSNITDKTRIIYCTHGILINIVKSELLRINSNHEENDKHMNIPLNSILILDEVHERSLDVDLLLFFVKQLVIKRSDIRIVIMSASITLDEFVRYFKISTILNEKNCLHSVKVGEIKLPGRTPFPIDISYFPINKSELTNDSSSNNEEPLKYSNGINIFKKSLDLDLVASKIISIISTLNNNTGSILVFVGGINDVNKLVELLKNNENNREFSIPLYILPCHSNLSYVEQSKIFTTIKNKRKVIVSTNIAEVSLTIEDIRYVIDTGRVRIPVYDSSKHLTTLQEVFISQSEAQQRMGRAGRTAPGRCFRLYSEYELLKQQVTTPPAVLRLPLHHIILDIINYIYSSFNNLNNNPNIESTILFDLIYYISDFLTPIKLSSIETSLNELLKVGALDNMMNITPLGKILSRWQVDLHIGILFVYGLIFDCIQPILTIAAFLTCDIPWKLKSEDFSTCQTGCDYMMFIKLFDYYIKNYSILKKSTKLSTSLDHDLPFNIKTLDLMKMDMICETRDHFCHILGIDRNQSVMPIDEILSMWSLIRGCIAVSLYPNIASIKLPNTIKYVSTGSGKFVEQIPFNKLHIFKSKAKCVQDYIDHFEANSKDINLDNSIPERYFNKADQIHIPKYSALYNRMVDIGTVHCITYMSLHKSYLSDQTIIKFPAPVSMYFLLLLAPSSLEIIPISLLEKMSSCKFDSESINNKDNTTYYGNLSSDKVMKMSTNYILVDGSILIRCSGQIQSLIWYLRYLLQEVVQYICHILISKIVTDMEISCFLNKNISKNSNIKHFTIEDIEELISIVKLT